MMNARMWLILEKLFGCETAVFLVLALTRRWSRILRNGDLIMTAGNSFSGQDMSLRWNGV